MPKFFTVFTDFFRSLKVNDHAPTMVRDQPSISAAAIMTSVFNSITNSTVSEDQHRINLENLELARLAQDREVINKTLTAQHRVLMVTLVATFIALFSSASAIFIALKDEDPKPPVVNVAPSQPDVNVYMPEPKPVEQPLSL